MENLVHLLEHITTCLDNSKVTFIWMTKDAGEPKKLKNAELQEKWEKIAEH